jgi:hypothetical protein
VNSMARAAEAASKEALRLYCADNGWRVAFFEGETGAPRTGIVDAIMFRVSRKNADVLDLRLVQLKGGKAGVSGAEIARLKKGSGPSKPIGSLPHLTGRLCICSQTSRTRRKTARREQANHHMPESPQDENRVPRALG